MTTSAYKLIYKFSLLPFVFSLRTFISIFITVTMSLNESTRAEKRARIVYNQYRCNDCSIGFRTYVLFNKHNQNHHPTTTDSASTGSQTSTEATVPTESTETQSSTADQNGEETSDSESEDELDHVGDNHESDSEPSSGKRKIDSLKIYHILINL